MNDRSYEGRHAGQQRYAVIEFCSNEETAWRKIASGKYDWLGMKRDTFVFGRPPAGGGLRGGGSMTLQQAGADGTHVVETYVPLGRVPTRRLFATPDRARTEYEAIIEHLRTPDGSSGMFKVRLIVDSEVEAEELVVRTLPNVI